MLGGELVLHENDGETVDLMVIRNDNGMRYRHKNGDPYG